MKEYLIYLLVLVCLLAGCSGCAVDETKYMYLTESTDDKGLVSYKVYPDFNEIEDTISYNKLDNDETRVFHHYEIKYTKNKISTFQNTKYRYAENGELFEVRFKDEIYKIELSIDQLNSLYTTSVNDENLELNKNEQLEWLEGCVDDEFMDPNDLKLNSQDYVQATAVLENIVTAEKLVSLIEEHNTNCFNLIKTFKKIKFDETVLDKIKKYL